MKIGNAPNVRRPPIIMYLHGAPHNAEPPAQPTTSQGAREQLSQADMQRPEVEDNTAGLVDDSTGKPALLNNPLFTGRDNKSGDRFTYLVDKQRAAEHHLQRRGLIVHSQQRSMMM
eukprot:TRINITY_DN46844_c0_g1_i1.p1 TRINITY_DN46844_c0_g1~~TRINITY_DN46844_c0_g1_i1.p1  ORF type:complete len:132 (+),score=10.46 TRINITY_DN46844_c0_g1_i1:49-396(+)